MSRTRWKSKETKFGCWNWLFVVAEQDQIMTIFSIYRIYGGVMGDMTKIYKIIQPKMAEVTACKCKKKNYEWWMPAYQKINSKFFINFLQLFETFLES